MSDTKAEVERYAQLAIETAINLNAIAEGEQPSAQYLEDIGHDGDENELDLGDTLDSEALEVYANACISADGSKDIRGIVIVLGTGGPHYEFEVDYQGRTVGRAYWGGEQAEAVTHELDALGEYLVEFFDGWDS